MRAADWLRTQCWGDKHSRPVVESMTETFAFTLWFSQRSLSQNAQLRRACRAISLFLSGRASVQVDSDCHRQATHTCAARGGG